MTVVARLEPRPRAAPAAADLLALAQDRRTDARERLLMGVISLCDAHPPGGELSPVLAEIFLTLARQAERDVRKVLSERLAHADWAPVALVNVLALDEIEIARPILAASPILKDDDLLRVLLEATLEHQIEVARRPHLSGRVADAIIDGGQPAPLTALAGNRTAEISEAGLRRLVEQSRRIAALRGPLTRHPRLTETLAEQMYAWVGVALRQAIGARFAAIDAAHLSQAVDDAVDTVRLNIRPAAVVDADRDEMDRRLVAKLQAAGQLRAGFLVRTVREKKLSQFVYALATLGGYPVEQVRAAMKARTAEALYYACLSVGVDRAAFPPLVTEIRIQNAGLPDQGGDGKWMKIDMSPTSAGRAFRALMAAPVI